MPSGPAPESVREQWLGLELSAIDSRAVDFRQLDDNDVIDENVPNGYYAESISAIDVLAKKSPEAAQWYRDRLKHKNKKSYFFFTMEFCEPV